MSMILKKLFGKKDTYVTTIELDNLPEYWFSDYDDSGTYYTLGRNLAQRFIFSILRCGNYSMPSVPYISEFKFQQDLIFKIDKIEISKKSNLSTGGYTYSSTLNVYIYYSADEELVEEIDRALKHLIYTHISCYINDPIREGIERDDVYKLCYMFADRLGISHTERAKDYFCCMMNIIYYKIKYQSNSTDKKNFIKKEVSRYIRTELDDNIDKQLEIFSEILIFLSEKNTNK
ncbi:hypothetical protein B0187_06450 [Haemophilus paracuniculus]|uniref:Uncharacterized protein n=2 Tax=Haemophilus paracuniculus TaxID=734 RepID=A0A1T0ARZ0_9PAST|nr:hypothetical protein B0187_06450 [Haemophilus paracuniculus]